MTDPAPTPPPIEDHAYIGDMRTGGLIDPSGTVTWMPMPAFDSPSVFTGLLGDLEDNGYWKLAPRPTSGHSSRPPQATRRYVDDTLITETEWDTADGTSVIYDFMPPCTSGATGNPQLIRIVKGISGRVRMSCDLNPQFDYGAVAPRWTVIESPFAMPRHGAVAGEHSLWLDSSVETTSHVGGHRVADFTIRSGEVVAFALTWAPSHLEAPPAPDPGAAFVATKDFWTTWAERCTYRGRYVDAVRRALITLKALTYAPTGGIVAAPTTSLPEEIGGSRNWDYRYVWLRDSAMILAALLGTGYRDEARDWIQWLLRAVAGDPQRLQIMYSITGRRDLRETTLPLRGYRDSKPVRVGNQAATQQQLDVYGEVIETLYLAHTCGLCPTKEAFELTVALLSQLQSQWKNPDEGIWEIRGHRQHFVHSKIMAWVAFDRGIQFAVSIGSTEHLDEWRRARDAIHRQVCKRGFDEDRNTFTQYYGSGELDASLLLIPLVGFLPPTDKRVIGTIDAIQRELSSHQNLVKRYPTDKDSAGVDGLRGNEGSFLICSFWLVESLAMIGRSTEAQEIYEGLLKRRNELGLLAEEYDPYEECQLGNYPQGFSMLGLITAALRIDGSPINDLPRNELVATAALACTSKGRTASDLLPIRPTFTVPGTRLSRVADSESR